MKIKLLLDENLPRGLMFDFSDDFEVTTVPDMGWANLKNGELLFTISQAGFTFLLTSDKSLRFQQNLVKYQVKVIVLRTIDNRYHSIAPHIAAIEKGIKSFPTASLFLEINLEK